MLRYLSVAGFAALSGFAAIPAHSQDFLGNRLVGRGNTTTVQSTFTSNIPLDESKDIAAQQVESLRAFYKMAGSSCADVLATVADSCELSRLTTSVSVADTGSRGRRLTINGQITMTVEFKQATGKGAN